MHRAEHLRPAELDERRPGRLRDAAHGEVDGPELVSTARRGESAWRGRRPARGPPGRAAARGV